MQPVQERSPAWMKSKWTWSDLVLESGTRGWGSGSWPMYCVDCSGSEDRTIKEHCRGPHLSQKRKFCLLFSRHLQNHISRVFLNKGLQRTLLKNVWTKFLSISARCLDVYDTFQQPACLSTPAGLCESGLKRVLWLLCLWSLQTSSVWAPRRRAETHKASHISSLLFLV